jgi:hypothetical protein
MIGLELAVAQFPFLQDIVRDVKKKPELGDLEIAFAIMDTEGGYRSIGPQVPIGSIDHRRDALMVRPAGSATPSR